jgi:hypothetical protein
MAEPLTKEERETHAAFCERQLRVRIGNSEEAIFHDMAHLYLRYEATVQDRDDRIVALEAELARLRPLAATGEAVEGMNRGHCLDHTHLGDIHPEDEWFVWEWPDEYGEQTPLANASTALAALRAAKGEACSSDS